MRPHLGHDEDFVALALQRTAEPLFASPLVIFQAVIEEGYSAIDGMIDDLPGDGMIVKLA